MLLWQVSAHGQRMTLASRHKPAGGGVHIIFIKAVLTNGSAAPCNVVVWHMQAYMCLRERSSAAVLE